MGETMEAQFTLCHGHIFKNVVCNNGRGMFIRGVVVKVENNEFRGNNGWAVNLDLRYWCGMPGTVSEVRNNSVAVIRKRKTGEDISNRTIRVSLGADTSAVQLEGNV